MTQVSCGNIQHVYYVRFFPRILQGGKAAGSVRLIGSNVLVSHHPCPCVPRCSICRNNGEERPITREIRS